MHIITFKLKRNIEGHQKREGKRRTWSRSLPKSLSLGPRCQREASQLIKK